MFECTIHHSVFIIQRNDAKTLLRVIDAIILWIHDPLAAFIYYAVIACAWVDGGAITIRSEYSLCAVQT